MASSLAFACADNEGLQVVTEFPKLHGRTVGLRGEGVFRACIEGQGPDGTTSGQQVAEFLVYRSCNTSKLTIDGLLALNRERQALTRFRDALEDAARTLPPVLLDQAILEVRLKDLVSDILQTWRSDRRNLSPSMRQLLSDGFFEEPQKLFEKISEATVGGAAAGAAAGHDVKHAVLGAAAGFVVGVVFRTADAWRRARKADRSSPLRYLTLAEKNGVAFALNR